MLFSFRSPFEAASQADHESHTSFSLPPELGTKNFDITYGLGYAAMTSATDKFGIAGMFVDQFDFGSAHTVSFRYFLRCKT